MAYDTDFTPQLIEEARWRRPLCRPYLMTGNHRILMHLDAFLIPQSFQWPAPGAPERIGKRNLCDEWPYWREMPPEEIALADGEIIGCAPLPPPQGNLLFHAFFRSETTDRQQEKSAGSGNAESTAEKALS